MTKYRIINMFPYETDVSSRFIMKASVFQRNLHNHEPDGQQVSTLWFAGHSPMGIDPCLYEAEP